MQFSDGDQVRGRHGTVWTRKGGMWWTEVGKVPISDDVAMWLVALDSSVTTTHRTSKISKSAEDRTYTDQVKYELKRGSGNEERD